MSNYDRWRTDTPPRYEETPERCPYCGIPVVNAPHDMNFLHGIKPADPDEPGCVFCASIFPEDDDFPIEGYIS